MERLITYKIKTQPTLEPVTLGDLKEQVHDTSSDQDTRAQSLLIAARELFEMHSGVTLLPTVWQAFADEFPGGDECSTFKLQRGPVTSLVSVIYVDADGTSTTLASTQYQSDIKSCPARVKPAYGLAWPVIRSQTMNAVTIEYNAGFASASVVPAKAKQAILLLAAHWHGNREAVGHVGSEIALAYWSLVDAVRWEVYDS